jgi:predicted Zn-dependent protease
MPALVHKTRARGLIRAKKIAEAQREIELSLASLPGNIEVAIDLAPELEKVGAKTEADVLVKRLLATQERLCGQFPKGAAHHNAVAWLLVRTRRDLDKAMEYASKAMELEPTSPAIIDTLAEVYFQRGDKVKAVETIQKCIELEPTVERHKLVLRRFQTEGPETDPPDER